MMSDGTQLTPSRPLNPRSLPASPLRLFTKCTVCPIHPRSRPPALLPSGSPVRSPGTILKGRGGEHGLQEADRVQDGRAAGGGAAPYQVSLSFPLSRIFPSNGGVSLARRRSMADTHSLPPTDLRLFPSLRSALRLLSLLLDVCARARRLNKHAYDYLLAQQTIRLP